jgi:hypothetical protein
MCARRQFLKLRIKSGLTLEDLPKFCYSVHKNIVFRDFRNKTIVYKPFDAYLYLIDFLDIYFHGDYRKLNKFISFKNWGDMLKIFDYRINHQKENFQYHLSENYMVFKFEDRIHIIFLNEKYVLCNANHEAIESPELLKGIIELYNKLYFPDVKIKLSGSKKLRLSVLIPKDVVNSISTTIPVEDNISKLNEYFWNSFHEDLDVLTPYCKKIKVRLDKYNNFEISLYIGLETHNYLDTKKPLPLRYRDMRLFLNFIYRIYNDYYVLWL